MAGIAVALDVPGRGRALELVDRLGDDGDVYKVGLELFTREGPAVVREIRERGRRVFLDLKLHDIPNTVARAVDAASEEGVEFLTLHASGGPTMLRAAAEAAAGRVRLLGVTVLTSLSSDELALAWGREGSLSTPDEVIRLGAGAVEAGVDGLVASAREVGLLRRALGDGPLLVTPGIRPAGQESHDQARVATPAEAVRAGADLLVVGRPVTRSDDPLAALRRIRGEMEEATVAGGAP